MGRVSGNKIARPAPKSPPKGYAPQTKPGHKPNLHAPTKSALKAGHKSTHASTYVAPVLTSKAKGNHLAAKPHKAHAAAALFGNKAPAIKPPTVDDLIRKEERRGIKDCVGVKFDYDKDGGMEGLIEKFPTLVRVTRRVASLTKVPFNYLIASLYAESHLTTNAVNKEARAYGMAQIKKIAWKQLRENKEEYKNFKDLWSQISPGVNLPSGPMQSPTADILFMAVWTLHREKEFPQMADLKGLEKSQARRLSYKLGDENTRKFVGILCREHQVTLGAAGESWKSFMRVLYEDAPVVAKNQPKSK